MSDTANRLDNQTVQVRSFGRPNYQSRAMSPAPTPVMKVVDIPTRVDGSSVTTSTSSHSKQYSTTWSSELHRRGDGEVYTCPPTSNLASCQSKHIYAKIDVLMLQVPMHTYFSHSKLMLCSSSEHETPNLAFP